MNARLKGLETMLKSVSNVQSRVDLINQAAWDLRHSDTASALMLCENSIQLAQSSGYLKGLAEAFKIRGYCKWRENDYAAALQDCHQALKLFQDLNDKAGQAATLTTLGNAYYKKGDPQSALESYQKNA